MREEERLSSNSQRWQATVSTNGGVMSFQINIASGLVCTLGILYKLPPHGSCAEELVWICGEPCPGQNKSLAWLIPSSTGYLSTCMVTCSIILVRMPFLQAWQELLREAGDLCLSCNHLVNACFLRKWFLPSNSNPLVLLSEHWKARW